MKVSLFYLIHPANSNSCKNWVSSRDFNVSFFVECLSPLLHIVSPVKQSKQLLTKKIRILLEETKYLFVQRKELKCNLFYLMNPYNSKKKTVAPKH